MLIHFGFDIDGCESVEVGLSVAAMVRAFYPPCDCGSKLFSGLPSSLIQHVLLQERKGAIHGRIITSCTDASHVPNQVIAGKSFTEFA